MNKNVSKLQAQQNRNPNADWSLSDNGSIDMNPGMGLGGVGHPSPPSPVGLGGEGGSITPHNPVDPNFGPKSGLAALPPNPSHGWDPHRPMALSPDYTRLPNGLPVLSKMIH